MKSVFYVSNLTPSIKRLPWDYPHKKQVVLALHLHWSTVFIFYKQSNLFDSLLKSVYKHEKPILVCQHYFLFWQRFFYFSLFLLVVLVSILVLFLYVWFDFLLILVFFFWSCCNGWTSNDFGFNPILIRKIK